MFYTQPLKDYSIELGGIRTTPHTFAPHQPPDYSIELGGIRTTNKDLRVMEVWIIALN